MSADESGHLHFVRDRSPVILDRMKPLATILLFAMVAQLCAAEPVGDSAAFESRDAVVARVRAMMDAGEFKQAEQLLPGFPLQSP
jgi:hypothetical protein